MNRLIGTALAASMVLFIGPLASLAAETSPAPKMTMTEHCENLVKQFKAADVTHVAPAKLESAKKQAADGEKSCKSNPKAGVSAMESALKDIGVTPK